MVNFESDDKMNALRSASAKASLSQKTNQDIINAAYKVGEQPQTEWRPLAAAARRRMGDLAEKAREKYKVRALEEIEGLTPEQKVAFRTILGI